MAAKPIKPTATQKMKRFPALRMDSQAPKEAGSAKVAGISIKDIPPRLAKLINQAVRLDGWENVISGAGVRGRDTRTAGRGAWPGIMPETEAEQLYASDELARRMVELPPRECLKNWIKFTGMEERTQEVEEELFRLKAPERFFEAACWARVYGGSALFMATGEDPEDFKYPLDPTAIEKVSSLVLFSRYELMVRSTDLETDINDPNYGQPKYYWLTPRKGNVSNLFTVKIHHSRLIQFDGKALPLRLKVYNRYWGDSIFTGLLDPLRDYGLSHASIANVLQKFRVAMYKMKDLVDQLASPDSQDVQNRIAKLNAVESVFGMYFLDEEETMEFHADNFAGVKDMLQSLKERLQSCCDIPHIVLFNESPGGGGGSSSSMGQSGDASLKSWYSYLSAEQKNYYTPKLDKLILTMLQAPGGPTAGEEPEGWDWEFNKIETPTEGEAADLEGKQLDNTGKKMGMGVSDVFDAMEQHNPKKLAQLNPTDVDRMRAVAQQVIGAEREKDGGPAANQLPMLPDNQNPLVQERSKGPVYATPRNSDGSKKKRPRTKVR